MNKKLKKKKKNEIAYLTDGNLKTAFELEF